VKGGALSLPRFADVTSMTGRQARHKSRPQFQALLTLETRTPVC
jgi:hypothetical protein